MMDLRRLNVLRAVDHYGTVTAAATALHLTTSAASQQIRQLGRELDVTLLEPLGRTVRLTDAARTLLAHADAIEARWQQARAELHATQGGPTGTLRLAAFPTAMCRLLGPVAASLRARHPSLTVRLREAEAVDCFDLLFTGEIDLAVVEALPANPPVDDPRFEQHTLLTDPFDLLLPTGHELADQPTVRLTDVADEPWIVGLPDDAARAHVLAACTAAGFSPAIAHEACDASLVATLVHLGLGVALYPRLSQLPPGLDVRRVPTGGNAPARTFLTCVRRGGREAPGVAAALTAVHELTAATAPATGASATATATATAT
ncbi:MULTISPECIES: LysR substrate-binding domain-containing protein [Prauserella salsuginis group]|uniref:LysR substrate-binding domain-containing protein n=1 Tax=Prauserella salsuginis TaxID=387889 RepID=A0ABW6G0G0_9PSEU|nr:MULTISPECIES: LysR substrate-binding domain-containing protein [Prauserella salsuginis group]